MSSGNAQARYCTCSNCAFYVATSETDGTCHRYAPQMAYLLNGNGVQSAAWFAPNIRPDWWCGEFKHKEPQS